MADKGRTARTSKRSKARGDDRGRAWEINDSKSERDERDDVPLQSPFDEKYQGEAWKINEKTEG